MFRHRILTRDEERDLGRRARGGDLLARDALVTHNLRFAAQQAAKYRGHGLDEDELISAAALGLLKAAQRFDERKGFRFISYAVWWCRATLQDSVAEANPVRLPHSRIAQVAKARAAQERAEQAQLREVSLESASGLSMQKFADLNPATHAPMELPCDGDGPAELAGPTDDLELRHGIRILLGTLDPRERAIIELRYGLNDGIARTYTEVGEHLGLSRERVRQIEKGAMKRLRGNRAGPAP